MIREADIPTEPMRIKPNETGLKDSTAPLTYDIHNNSIPPEIINVQPLTNAMVTALKTAIAEGRISTTRAYTILADTDCYAELEIAARSKRYSVAERTLAQIIVNVCKNFPDLEPHAGSAFSDARTALLLRHQAPTGFEKKDNWPRSATITHDNNRTNVDVIRTVIQNFIKSPK